MQRGDGFGLTPRNDINNNESSMRKAGFAGAVRKGIASVAYVESICPCCSLTLQRAL